jgi:hypothetical protein
MTPHRDCLPRLRATSAALGVGLLCLGLLDDRAPATEPASSAALEAVARSVEEAGAACGPARLYLWTDPIAPHLEIEVSGNDGDQSFTFASGTTLLQIATAIDAFAAVTGVDAAPLPADHIELISRETGPSAFVRVRQLSDPPGRVLKEPLAGPGSMALVATGPSAITADLNCDFSVDALDFLLVLRAWGPCAELAPCPGDLDESGVVDHVDLDILVDKWTQP